MSGKKKKQADGYNSMFAIRMRDLIEGTTQIEVADSIGTTRQTVSYYCTGLARPDSDTLYKIAKHFNVSADYLLGLPNESAEEITGLSNKSIKALAFLNRTKNEKYCEYNKNAISFLNRVLEKTYLMIQEKNKDNDSIEESNGVANIFSDLENFILCEDAEVCLPKECNSKEFDIMRKTVPCRIGDNSMLIPVNSFARQFLLEDIKNQLLDFVKEKKEEE